MNAEDSGRPRHDVALTSIRAGLVAGVGRAPMAAQLVLHAIVSITLAAPFVTFARWRGPARFTAGASYGVFSWGRC